jgi:hypothetical protein
MPITRTPTRKRTSSPAERCSDGDGERGSLNRNRASARLGGSVQIASPALILTYVVGAFLAWRVTNAFGELASAHLGAGSFGLYADLYLIS